MPFSRRGFGAYSVTVSAAPHEWKTRNSCHSRRRRQFPIAKFQMWSKLRPMRIKVRPRPKSVVVEVERLEKELPPIAVTSLQLKKILLPVDFSGTSRKALGYVVSFAKQFNAEAVLLHVIEPAAAAPQTETFSAIINSPKRREDCEEQLSQWRHEFRPGAQTELREGSASREIVRAADEHNVDLIIIGTQGRTGLARMFGSTAEWVVRHAPCPVLIVRERERDFVQPG